MTAAEKARFHAERAWHGPGKGDEFTAAAVVNAQLASAYASLALVEELGRFEAVAVEPREQQA